MTKDQTNYEQLLVAIKDLLQTSSNPLTQAIVETLLECSKEQSISKEALCTSLQQCLDVCS